MLEWKGTYEQPARLWLVALVIGSIVVGVFFRFYHLDRKVYSDDEIFTSLRALGYTERSVVERSPSIANSGDLRAVFNQPASAIRQSVSATAASLALEEPQHPPGYYALAHFWVRLFGSSSASIRSLSALIGLLVLPSIYWLCIELFRSRTAAWIGVALLAISPVEVLFSQEAREYSLWATSALLLSASFLRAMRVKTILAWGFYGLSLGLGLYVYPLTGVLAIGHAVYLAAMQRSRPDGKAIFGFMVSLIAGTLLFVPWLLIMLGSRDQIHRDLTTIEAGRSPLSGILRLAFGMFKLDFVDLNILRSAGINFAFSLAAALLVAFALYHVCRNLEVRVWGFILVMIAASTLPLILGDVLFAGQRTAQTRYFVPFFLGMNLAIVGLFAAKLSSLSASSRMWQFWRAVLVIVIAGRVVSCAASARADTWWNKWDEKSIAIAHTINQSPRPVVISDNYIDYLLSLANYLDPKVSIVVRPRCYTCSLAARPGVEAAALRRLDRYSDVFLLGPSPELQAAVRESLRSVGVSHTYRCINVKGNCASTLSLWEWIN